MSTQNGASNIEDDAQTAETVKVVNSDNTKRTLIAILNDLVFDEPSGDALMAAEITLITDFGEDKQTAASGIAKFLEDNKLDRRTGLKTALLKIYTRTAEATKKSKPKSAKPPKLPAGKKFDLSGPTIKLDGTEYKIPDTVEEPKGDVPDPFSFDDMEWMSLARRTGILYGINLDKAYSVRESEYSDAVARHNALVWKVPEGRFLDAAEEAGVRSDVTMSAHKQSLVHNWMTSDEVHGSYMGFAASASVDYTSKHAEASQTKTIFMTGTWYLPFARLEMRECTTLSDAFLEELRDVLRDEGTAIERFERLSALHAKYGHVVSNQVSLGGAMYFTARQEQKATATSDSYQLEIKAAVDYKSGGAEGGFSGTYQDAETTEEKGQSLAKSSAWTTANGDKTLIGSPKTWKQSLKNPNTWSIIRRSGVTALFDWLDDMPSQDGPALKAQAEAVWNQGLLEIWGGRTPPRNRTQPLFGNRPFLIRTGANLDDGALGAVAEDKGAPVVIGQVDENSENIADYCWTLVYMGHSTSVGGVSGEPIYAIVTWRDAQTAQQVHQLRAPGKTCHALSAKDPAPTGLAAEVVPFETLASEDGKFEMPAPDDVRRACLWTVTPMFDDTTDQDAIRKYWVESLWKRRRLIPKISLRSGGRGNPNAQGFLGVVSPVDRDHELASVFLMPAGVMKDAGGVVL